MSDRKKSGKRGRKKEDWDLGRAGTPTPYVDPAVSERRSRQVRISGRRRWFLILFAASTYFWLYMKLNWPSTLTDAPEITARLYAKEYCSCTFVIGQNFDECRKAFGQIIPPFSIRVYQDIKIVEAQVLWVTARAMYQGDRLGCTQLP